MEQSMSFSALNERLRPRITSSQQLYSSLNRLEARQANSLRSVNTSYRPSILPAQPEQKLSETLTAPEDLEESEQFVECGDVVSADLGRGHSSDPLPLNTIIISELSLKDEGDEDSSSSLSKDEDVPGELTPKGAGDPSQPSAGDAEGSPQSGYEDGTLPDLIRSGRPLGRRRTLGHVSETLKEVRREVELSRRRSIKLKQQVDKLQESREGTGWSQHRERVTEEVLSVLRLLHPLTEPKSGLAETPDGENQLDAALVQLKTVARTLAISHTKQATPGKGAEDSAILKQALCDRDDAIEKKKAMEAELLRSKTEMMLLNNQLLEAVQKRLELSLELEAWKEDVQLILHQQLQSQQQAEQAQKKSSRMGILRRNRGPVTQRPSSLSTPAPPNPPSTNSSQIFISKPAPSATPAPSIPPASATGTQRNWRDKLRRTKGTRPADQEEAGQEWGRGDSSFQVVPLD